MKRITTYIILLVALASCANDEVININKDTANSNALRFQAMPTIASRADAAATTYTASNLDNLVVFANYDGNTTSEDNTGVNNAGKPYITNMELTRVSGSSGYSYEYQPKDNTTNQYVWPFYDEPLNFFCFTSPAPVTTSNEAGLTYYEKTWQEKHVADNSNVADYGNLITSAKFDDMPKYTEYTNLINYWDGIGSDCNHKRNNTDAEWYYETKLGLDNMNDIATGLAKELTLGVHINCLQKTQQDLVYAVTGNVKQSYNSNTVPLYFKHAFSKVRFNIKVENKTMLVKLYGMTLRNVAWEGTLKLVGPTYYYKADGTAIDANADTQLQDVDLQCYWVQPEDYDAAVSEKCIYIDYSDYHEASESASGETVASYTTTDKLFVNKDVKTHILETYPEASYPEAYKNNQTLNPELTDNFFYVIPIDYTPLKDPTAKNDKGDLTDYGIFLDLDFEVYNICEDIQDLTTIDSSNSVLMNKGLTHNSPTDNPEKPDLMKVSSRIPLTFLGDDFQWEPGYEYTYTLTFGGYGDSYKLYSSECTDITDYNPRITIGTVSVDSWPTNYPNSSLSEGSSAESTNTINSSTVQ